MRDGELSFKGKNHELKAWSGGFWKRHSKGQSGLGSQGEDLCSYLGHEIFADRDQSSLVMKQLKKTGMLVTH